MTFLHNAIERLRASLNRIAALVEKAVSYTHLTLPTILLV